MESAQNQHSADVKNVNIRIKALTLDKLVWNLFSNLVEAQIATEIAT